MGIGNDGVGKTCLVKNFCEKKVFQESFQILNFFFLFSFTKMIASSHLSGLLFSIVF